MTAPVIPEHEPPDPDDYADPEQSTAEVAAVKDLLLWTRKHGFTMHSIKVGRVELVDVQDMFPRRPLGASLPPSDSGDGLDGDPNSAALRAFHEQR